MDIENGLVAKGKRVEGGMEWEAEVRRCKLLYIERINKILLYSTENYIQYPVINHKENKYLKKNVNITQSLCCTTVINTTYNCKSTIPQFYFFLSF